MKLIHIFPYDYKVSGGHSNAILAFMHAQAGAGFDVEGVSPAEDGAVATDRIRYASLKIRYVENGDLNQTVKSCFSEGGKNLVVFYQSDPFVKKCAAMVLQTGNSYMISSGGMLHYRGAIHFIKKFVYLNLFSFSFLRGASAFHFITERERVRARVLLPFVRAPFLLVPNVVDIEEAGSAKPSDRDDGSPFEFIYLGRIDPVTKGLDIAVRAFSKIAAAYNCRLTMAGPDWKNGADTLRKLASKLGCADKVEILGPKYGAEKWAFLSSGDAFLALSRWEAFGIAIIEAAATGTPVLASNRLNLVDDMRKNNAAYISSLSVHCVAKAMEQMISDKTRRKEIADNGKKWAETSFSTAAVGEIFRRELAKIK
jgi:glycosyltransferase involved in cell wall biosynthesis